LADPAAGAASLAVVVANASESAPAAMTARDVAGDNGGTPGGELEEPRGRSGISARFDASCRAETEGIAVSWCCASSRSENDAPRRPRFTKPNGTLEGRSAGAVSIVVTVEDGAELRLWLWPGRARTVGDARPPVPPSTSPAASASLCVSGVATAASMPLEFSSPEASESARPVRPDSAPLVGARNSATR
jgi:hypothetical protein